jgi:Rrf2 family protein
MKLNKKTQYGLLLVLYICRAGRATIKNTALNLRLSVPFLTQVALQLRASGVIKSVRGPAGGYELQGKPTVGDVIGALNSEAILEAYNTRQSYSRGSFEHRALAGFMTHMNSVISCAYARGVMNVGTELVEKELRQMDRTTGRSH